MSSNNKAYFQQTLTWVVNNSNGCSFEIYLGGGHSHDKYSCIKVQDGSSICIPSLYCYHEEAEDRILYHINHSVEEDNIKQCIVEPNDISSSPYYTTLLCGKVKR